MSNILHFQKHGLIDDFTFKPKMTVGIHGILGSFNDQAWNTFVSEDIPDVSTHFQIVELVESEKVLRAVSHKEVDIGIFAFANSGSGGYLASVEAMGKYNYRVLAQFTMPINMCMLVHPTINSIDEIKLFFGHPVAINQCRKTLVNRWPNIPIKSGSDGMDTALSAKLLSEGKISKENAIFASKRAAERYSLKVLFEGVHHDPNNATAFVIITHY